VKNEFEELNGKFAVIVENQNDLSATTAQDRATFTALTSNLAIIHAIANTTVNARIDTLESRINSLEAAATVEAVRRDVLTGKISTNQGREKLSLAPISGGDTFARVASIWEDHFDAPWIKAYGDQANEIVARVDRLESVLRQLIEALNDDEDEGETEAPPVATAEQVMDAYKARIRSEDSE
jgi:hypothetical protein